MTTLEIFRLVAKEFASLSDETVEKWVKLTEPLISRKVFGKLYEQALALLTAHRLKMAGHGDTSLGTVGDTLRVGSYSEGEVSIGFSTSQAVNMQVDGEYSLTPYGLKYLGLRRLVVIPIRSAGERP